MAPCVVVGGLVHVTDAVVVVVVVAAVACIEQFVHLLEASDMQVVHMSLAFIMNVLEHVSDGVGIVEAAGGLNMLDKLQYVEVHVPPELSEWSSYLSNKFYGDDYGDDSYSDNVQVGGFDFSGLQQQQQQQPPPAGRGRGAVQPAWMTQQQQQKPQQAVGRGRGAVQPAWMAQQQQQQQPTLFQFGFQQQ